MLKEIEYSLGRSDQSLLIIMKISVDTETTGLHWTKGHKPFGIGIYHTNGTKDYIDAPILKNKWTPDWSNPFSSRNGLTFEEFKEQIESVEEIYFHNAKFDIHMLSTIGIYPNGKIHDTMFMARTCNNREKNFKLKPLAKNYIGIQDDDEKDLKKAVMAARRKMNWETEPLEELYWLPKYLDPTNDLCEHYCLLDVERTYKLAEYYLEGLEVLGVKHTYDFEMAVMIPIIEMEKFGVRFFREKAEKKFFELQSQLQRINMRLKETYGDINFNSHQQLGKLLINLGVPLVERTDASDLFPNGQLKTGAKVLDDFKNDFNICKLLVYRDKIRRSVDELKNYLDCCVGNTGNETIHPSINQCNAVTWRFSMTYPNLQKTTSKEPEGAKFICMRDLFGPRKDYVWLAADYEQIELRIFADSSQEPHLLDAFRNKRDVHDETTNRIPFLLDLAQREGWERARKYGKNTNFTIVNGGGVNALWNQYRIPKDQGKKCIEGFKSAYKDAQDYMRSQVSFARENGYIITKTKRKLRTDPERPFTTAISYDIQPSAGDIMKQGLLNCYNWIKENSNTQDIKILLSIHDELIFEIKKDVFDLNLVRTLKELMEKPSEIFCIPIPVGCDLITHNWRDKTKLEI